MDRILSEIRDSGFVNPGNINEDPGRYDEIVRLRITPYNGAMKLAKLRPSNRTFSRPTGQACNPVAHSGNSLESRTEMAGTRTISVTMDLYSYVTPEMQEDAALRVDSVLRAALSKRTANES